jgi:hypothetical protein
MQADQAAIEHARLHPEQVKARLLEDRNARRSNAKRPLETIRPGLD